jgi:hypothetical protein
MQEFDLPVLDRNTLLRDAFRPMITERKSGIVVVSYQEPHLLTFGDIEVAFGRGQQSLSQVESEAALSLFDKEPVRAVSELQSHGRRFGILRYTGNMARVLSVSEAFAGVYLSAPPGTVCKNPTDPHFYPPNHRDLARPHKCVICEYPLP